MTKTPTLMISTGKVRSVNYFIYIHTVNNCNSPYIFFSENSNILSKKTNNNKKEKLNNASKSSQ